MDDFIREFDAVDLSAKSKRKSAKATNLPEFGISDCRFSCYARFSIGAYYICPPNNMDEVSYPVRIEQNQKVMYAYSEWETINQDGDTREKSATPQSFDIIIDNAMILSNIKSPSGKQTLDFGEFDGKEITGTGYKITFQFTSHWE